MNIEERKSIIEGVITVLSTVSFITEEELFHIIDELGLESQTLKVCFKTSSLEQILEEFKLHLNK